MEDCPQQPARLRTADTLKGILILGVVFVHLFFISQVDDTGRSAPVYSQIAYLGLMGFFVVSGYFYRPGRSFAGNVRNRAGRLALVLTVCAVTLPVIMYALMWATGQPVGTEDMFNSMLSGLSNFMNFVPVDSYIPNDVCHTEYANYFLWLVFWSSIVLYALPERVVRERNAFLVSVAVLLCLEAALTYLGLRLPFYSNLLPISAALVITGSYLSQHRVIERLEEASLVSPRTWFPLAVSIVLLVVTVILFPPGIKFNFTYFGEYGGMSVFPYYVEGLLVFVVFLYIARLLSAVPVLSSVFEVCGRHTLALAIFHLFIVKAAMTPFVTIPTDVPLPAMSALETVVAGFVDVIVIVGLSELWKKALYVMTDKRASAVTG